MQAKVALVPAFYKLLHRGELPTTAHQPAFLQMPVSVFGNLGASSQCVRGPLCCKFVAMSSRRCTIVVSAISVTSCVLCTDLTMCPTYHFDSPRAMGEKTIDLDHWQRLFDSVYPSFPRRI